MAGEVVGSAIAEGDERYRLFAPFGLEWAGGPLGPAIAQAFYTAYYVRDVVKELRHNRTSAARA